jgi:KUP system potassium uptake protein
MRTWVKGCRFINEHTAKNNMALPELMKKLASFDLRTAKGTAMYLTSNNGYAPSALLKNLKHNHVLHEQNIILTLLFDTRPFVPLEERVQIQTINDQFKRITMSFGYMESPDVMAALPLLASKAFICDMAHTTFFISRRNIIPSASFGMPVWRDRIYIAMANNASDAADYFNLPLDRVVEIGEQMTV